MISERYRPSEGAKEVTITLPLPPGTREADKAAYRIWAAAARRQLATRRFLTIRGDVEVEAFFGRLWAGQKLEDREQIVLRSLFEGRVIESESAVKRVTSQWVAGQGVRVIVRRMK